MMPGFQITVFDRLKDLPHFDPELSVTNTPETVLKFRSDIESADGILICSPEYIFNMPALLKNAIEWCVSTTVFSGKPTGLITASADGRKGHEQLMLVMKTIEAKVSQEASLLIQGIKGKINKEGVITDRSAADGIENFIEAFKQMLHAAE